jgi:hypothetical protein
MNEERRTQNAELRSRPILNSSFCVLRSSFILFLLLACAPDHIDRRHWQTMSRDDRVLYVRSLIGKEKVKDAKGGNGRVFVRPAEEYVARIDEAYARGDSRTAEEIFETMGTRR